VATDNSVLSTYLADARIEYTGQGDISDRQREGWFSRFIGNIWPF
jgi:flagellar L-ring protein precursor FlgH